MSSAKNRNKLILSEFIAIALLVVVGALATYAYRLHSELNGSRTSYAKLKSSQTNNLKNCITDAGSGYTFDSVGVSGAIPQEVNLQRYQTQISACKAEYGN